MKNACSLIYHLDSIIEFDQYRNWDAEYDDKHYENIPINLLNDFGITKEILDEVNNNSSDLGGGWLFIHDNLVTIGGES